MSFGENLRKYRLKKNMSQIELGKAIGVSDRMIQKYEAGVSIPKIDVVAKCVRVLRVTYDDLLGSFKPRM